MREKRQIRRDFDIRAAESGIDQRSSSMLVCVFVFVCVCVCVPACVRVFVCVRVNRKVSDRKR